MNKSQDHLGFSMESNRRNLLSILYLFSLFTSSRGHPHAEDVLEVIDHASHLFFHLLDNHHYVPHLRPATNNESLVVGLNVIVTGITDLDERSQELGTSLMVMAVWRDYRLIWNVTDYDGISSLRVPAAQIWKPDLSLLHTMYGSFDHLTKGLATVTAEGEVSLWWHYKVRSSCSVDLTNFPFDTHSCHVTLVDTSHTGDQIRFRFIGSDQPSPDELSHVAVSVSSQWEVVPKSVEKSIGRLLHPEMVDYINVRVQLQRKSDFYHCVVVGPVVMIALLVPTMFLLPVDTSGKITLGCGVLVSLLLSLKTLCDVIGPNRSAAPRIAVFHVTSMALCTVSIVITAILTPRRRNTRKPVPAWMNRILLGSCGLRRWMCMDPYPVADHTMTTAGEFQEHESDVTPLKERDTKEVSRNVRTLLGSHVTDQSVTESESDWREIGLMIDRLLLLVFSLTFLLTTAALLS